MWLFWVAIGGLIFVLCVGGYTFRTACRREKEQPWLDSAALEKTHYGKYANHIQAGSRWLDSHTKMDVWMKSHDELKLHGVWVPAENPKGTILLAHGYRSCKFVDFGLVFELYHNLGMNLLLIDQRSHGHSEGKYITFGVLESRDVQGWIRYHNQHLGQFPLVLSGLSMGASTVLYLADRELPENVKGIIADCGFTSPRDIINKVFQDVVHLPAGPFLWAADLFARVLAGFSFYERDTRKTLAKTGLPVFLIHGTADDFVPCWMTEQAYTACTGEKELLLVEGAEHGVSYLIDTQNYRQRVIEFLKRNVDKEI